ncbi:MAG TPA: hypothetical protein VM328_04385, partial [Fimbriimonadaceae bacterium]|nr:hypothetical protein [Fimbriimonadaceae bacterium]
MSIRNPSPAEPVTEVRRVPILECGEPMVDFLAHCPLLVFDRPRFAYTRATQARLSVADALLEA